MKVLLSTLFSVAMFIQCGTADTEAVKHISVEEAIYMIENNSDLVIVDVRTPEEWQAGIIEKAIKINIKDADFKDKVNKLNKDKPTLVYCKRGGRSAKAAEAMEELGFKKVFNMKGGYDEYFE